LLLTNIFRTLRTSLTTRQTVKIKETIVIRRGAHFLFDEYRCVTTKNLQLMYFYLPTFKAFVPPGSGSAYLLTDTDPTFFLYRPGSTDQNPYHWFIYLILDLDQRFIANTSLSLEINFFKWVLQNKKKTKLTKKIFFMKSQLHWQFYFLFQDHCEVTKFWITFAFFKGPGLVTISLNVYPVLYIVLLRVTDWLFNIT